MNLLEARPQGNGWIARLEGVDERDAASRLSGSLVLVDRVEFAPTGAREYLVPVTAQHLRKVDAESRSLIVDWPEDF